MEHMRKNLNWYVLGAVFVFTTVIWYVSWSENVTNQLKVSFLDVGQGDAIFIESPEKTQILIDGGPNRSVLSTLSKEMSFFDHYIDALMVSNPDKDHIAGLVDVLDSYKVGVVILPGTLPNTEVYKAFISRLEKKNIKIILARRGEKIWLDKFSYIDILFPDRDVSELETNTGSIVAKLIYGKTSMLLTGDTPLAVEDYLVKLEGKNLKSDILKVAHHGSKNSLSLSFFGNVGSQFAAVSVGVGNSYGHPNKETLEALDQFGFKILRTDKMGTIRFVSDGNNFELKNKQP